MRVIRDRSTMSSRVAAHFTGQVWRTDYIEPDHPEGISGSRFLYEPAARSHWHIHEQEQAIIAVYGSGLIAWEGLDAPQPLEVGDWWHVEPGVPHWHGAIPDSVFAHLAVTAGGATIWLREVADRDYAVPPRR
jgi:quercetin dioxygenase-like cupin family protein